MSPLRAPRGLSASETRGFVRELERRLQPLDRAILLADWNQQTGRSTRTAAGLQRKRLHLLSDEGLLDWVRAARRERWPRVLSRQLELLERIVLDTRVEQDPEVAALRSQLNSRIVAFRPQWEGRRVGREVVHRVLRQDPDPTRRRRAYYTLESLHRPLEEEFRRLVRLRNERAREAGFRSMAHLRLGFQGLTPERVRELIDGTLGPVPRGTRRLRELLSQGDRSGEWYPWDQEYAREQRAPLPDRLFPRGSMLPRVLRAVSRWGFRTPQMRFRVVFHDLPAGGLTLAPDPPSDVRILVHPRGGWGAYHVMFHEVGHAVQSASLRAPGHLLRWHENIPGFGGFHEGIGSLFEEIPRDAGWLVGEAGVDRRSAEAFARAEADRDLFNVGYLGPWIQAELDLYRNPDQDPMPAAEALARRLFGFGAYRPRSFVDWFYVADPIYSANYLLATLFHYQLTRTITSELGAPLWPNRRVGPWLTRHWFRAGSFVEWGPHLREVTGARLSARAFLERFSES